MADIALEAGISPEDTALAGASKLFGHLWNSAWEHGHHTASGEVDALHDMRVNLRRLRTALQNFEGPRTAPLLSVHLRAEIRDERERIAGLGDKLGAVRDYDVLMEYVEGYSREKLGLKVEESPGLAELERYLQTERASCFKPMVKQLNRAQQPGALRESFGRWALGLPAASGAGISMVTVARVLLPRRLDALTSHGEALAAGAEPEAQHGLRKDLRRIRYTLESLSVCLKEPVKPYLKVLVELQDSLGEMQDRAVLAGTVARAFGTEPPQDVSGLLNHGTRRRSYLLGQARKQWQATHRDGFWRQLQELV